MENENQIILLDFCKKSFPVRENIRIKDFARISDGWENEVYSFTMEYIESGEENYEDLILRIYQGNSPEQKAIREFQGMKNLYHAGYPVPKVMILASENSPFGKPIVIMEKINGQIMGRVFSESTDEKKKELIALFCKMFVHLHSLDWRSFVSVPSFFKNVREYKLFDLWLEMGEKHIKNLKAEEYIPILDWLKERRLQVTCEYPSVIHYDYHPYNIILGDDGKAYVIDWTNIDVADYRFDLAWTILLTSAYGNPEAREIIINNYEEISGKKTQKIEIFEVAAALRRLFSISTSIRYGADKLGMRPQASEMMKQNIGHIENVYAFLIDRTGVTIPQVEIMISELKEK